MNAQSQLRIAGLNIVVDKIDAVIGIIHSLPFDFAKGSAVQRLVTDLDGARVTARAIIDLEKNNANPTERDPHLNPNR